MKYSKYSRIKERDITIKVIESKIHYRILAEFFARKYSENKKRNDTSNLSQ